MSPVRLPLQIGTSSLWHLARAAAAIGPGVAFLGAAIGFVASGGGGGWVSFLIVGLLLFAYSIVQIARAYKTRPSDAVLDAEGLRLEGGAQAGLRIPWADIDPDQTRAETTREARATGVGILSAILGAIFENKLEQHEADRVPVRRLHLAARDGRCWALAEAEHPAEAESLDALLGSLHAKLRPPTTRAEPASQQVVSCGGCGAPVPPADSDGAACRYCGTVAAMPAGVRERMRAHQQMGQSRTQLTAVVNKLLRQPRAGWASAVLVLATLVCLVAWTAALIPLLVIGTTKVGVFEVGWALAAGLFTSLAAFILGRAALANRRALQLLASSFGARAPRDQSGVYTCRRCGGPLPASQSLVVQCAYCDADNVLGVDLRHEVAPTEAHRWDLQQVLQSRRKEQIRWLLGSLGAGVLVAVSVVMGLVSVVMAQEFNATRAACESGDAAACHSLAVDYDLGISVAEDEEQAVATYLRACKLGSAEACHEIADRLHYGWAMEEDQDAAVEYRTRACELGHAEACQPRE